VLIRKGKPLCQHDERLIQRFIEGNTDAWLEEGCPFHLWLTSPAFEILDVTFAMHLGSAKNREEYADLIVYQSAHGDFNTDPESAEIRYLKGLQSLDGKSAYWGDLKKRIFTYAKVSLLD